MAKIALLIGVSEYQPGLNPLPGATKDVEAMCRILQHPESGGFDQVKALLNPEPLEMQTEIQTAFSSSRRKDDLVLLFFSGHGVKDERGNLYLTTRITRKTEGGELVKATSVPASFVHDIMSNCRSKRQVVILDCCFSGAFAEGLLAKEDHSVDIRKQLGSEGRAVLTSSTSTQYSFEQQGSELSIYTHYLIEGISTGAADQDKDGMVSVDELHEYAKGKVQEAAPAMKPEIYAVKEGYKIMLAKAPIGDPKLSYRREVERFASRGEISLIGRMVLDEERKQLGMRPEEADVIEEEVLKPYREYQQKLQLYEQACVEMMEQDNSLGDITRLELEQLQQVFSLRDEDVAPIEARLTSPPAAPIKQLQQLDEIPNSIEIAPEPQPDTEKLQFSAYPETAASQPASLGRVAPQLQPEAKTSAALNPEFIERCRRELARCIGPVASFILEDILAQAPQIAPQQLVESLAVEITNPQKAQEFKQHLL